VHLQIHTYQLGQAHSLPGISLAVTRHPPRGVKRKDYLQKGVGHAWLPLLGPSRELLQQLRDNRIDFARFTARYRKEMTAPAPRQVITLLAALIHQHRLNLGCYCHDETQCHRTLLAALIREAALDVPRAATASGPTATFFSPACSMPEIDDTDEETASHSPTT
jgi:uncharacterized protein YeaO (DUF488 family)